MSVYVQNGAPPQRAGSLRWVICGMLFLATTINYIDRFALSFLARPLQEQFRWTDVQYGWILFTFQAAYASMNVAWGGVMDRLGLRRGYFLAVVIWSFAAMGHAFARSAFGFGFWRFWLGVGEAGNWPGAIKTISEWFPQRERATATGLFNGGANIGAMIAPPLMAALVLLWGWQAAFVFVGSIGFMWATAWWIIYRPVRGNPRLSPPERAWITQDGVPAETARRIPWGALIRERRTWAFILGKALSDPVWAFFLFWFPKFLGDTHHLTTAEMARVVWIPYLAADVGSIGGGFMSSFLIHRGWGVNAARKTTMAVAAFSIPFVYFAGTTHELWLVIALVSLALAMHQWWSANLFTLTSDMFPTAAIGSVVGLGQLGGSGMAMAVQPLIGKVHETTGSYLPMFIAAAIAYPLALLCVQLFAPRISRAPVAVQTA